MTDISKVVALAADHAAFELKNRLGEVLTAQGYTVLDLGTYSADRVDYPDYGHKLAEAIAAGQAARGVGLCGSGIGISIALNRHPAIRAALVSETTSARLAREHNDANVIVFGARLIGAGLAEECLNVFLNTPFEGGRHAERLKKLGSC